MSNEQELQTAWQQAYSVPPGTRPPGSYIGSIEKNGRVYEFYKDGNAYWYESYNKGGARR